MMLGKRGVTTLPVSDGEPSRRRPATVVPLLDHRWLPEPLPGNGPQQRPNHPVLYEPVPCTLRAYRVISRRSGCGRRMGRWPHDGTRRPCVAYDVV